MTTTIDEAPLSETACTMTEIQRYVFENGAQLAETLANCVCEAISTGIAARGRASVVLSGGTTPVRLYRQLSGRPVAWKDVAITLSDERWVDEDSADSNAAMLHRELLVGEASAASFVSLKTGHDSPESAEADCAQRLAGMPLPYDIVVLGMGTDGHTASLFPGSESLARALDPANPEPCIAVRPPGVAQPRMSLTLSNLLDSQRLVLLISGDAKLRVLETALQDGPLEEMPVRALLRQTKVPLDVYWAP